MTMRAMRLNIKGQALLICYNVLEEERPSGAVSPNASCNVAAGIIRRES